MAVDPRAFSRALAAALVLTVGGFAVGLLSLTAVAQLLVLAGVPLVQLPALERALTAVMLQGIGFGSVALAYLERRRWASHLWRIRSPSLSDVSWTVTGFLALYVSLLGSTTLFSAFGVQTAQHEITEHGTRNPEIFLVMIPLSFLLVGPGEELLFRGMVQGRLLEATGPLPAVTLTSIIFAVVHVPAFRGDGVIATLLVIFLLSFVLGAVYEYTDNIVVPATIHGAYNATQFALLYLRATGGVSIG